MKITREETPDRQAILHIEVDKDRLDDYMHRAYQRLVQRTNIPGFRRGKAPRALVERFVGHDYMLDEALEGLVPAVVSDAVREEELEPATTPRISIVEREPTVKLDATIALRPEVKLGDYNSIKFDDKPEAVPENQVDESIERIRDFLTTFSPVERAVQAKDMATLTVNGAVDGQPLVDLANTRIPVDHDNDRILPGFSEAITGMNPGEVREFELPVPEDYRDAEFAGKTAVLSVELLSLEEPNRPPLDDELARNFDPELETLDALRSQLRTNLEERAENELRRSLEERVADALVEGADIKMAPLLVEHETEHMLSEQQESLSKHSLSLQNYIHSLGQTTDDYLENARSNAETRLKRSLVIEELANAENIEVTDEQVSEEIERIRQNGQENPDPDSDETRGAVKRMLRRRAAMDRAVEIAREEKSQLWTPSGSGPETAPPPEAAGSTAVET